MPGKHSARTKLLGFYADHELIRRVDEARGPDDRSRFMRDAIIEHVERRGIRVPDRLRGAPDRTGKGGRLPEVTPQSAMLNHKPVAAAAANLLKSAAAKPRKARPS
jgi:hypothetical protein